MLNKKLLVFGHLGKIEMEEGIFTTCYTDDVKAYSFNELMAMLADADIIKEQAEIANDVDSFEELSDREKMQSIVTFFENDDFEGVTMFESEQEAQNFIKEVKADYIKYGVK